MIHSQFYDDMKNSIGDHPALFYSSNEELFFYNKFIFPFISGVTESEFIIKLQTIINFFIEKFQENKSYITLTIPISELNKKCDIPKKWDIKSVLEFISKWRFYYDLIENENNYVCSGNVFLISFGLKKNKITTAYVTRFKNPEIVYFNKWKFQDNNKIDLL